MVYHLFFYQLVLIALVWLCVMLHWAWPSDPAAACPPPELPPLLPKRKREPKPFAGLTTKPPVVYLHPTDKYPKLTHRPSQGQKGIDERALMAFQRPPPPW
jgi:hypothetical protein